jgi:hypothetical protein
MANQYTGALPPFADFKKQLLASMDRFYLLRKAEKSISLNFVSDRPDYEKKIENTFYYGAVTKDKFDKAGLSVSELVNAGVIYAAGNGYLFKLDIPNDQWGWYTAWYYAQYPQYAKFAYQNSGSFNIPAGPAYFCYIYKSGALRDAIDRLANYSRTVHLLPDVVLKHDTPPTEFHEFNLMQQVQFDDQEFVEVLLVSSNKTYDDNKNYLNTQLTVKNIAEPKKIPFDILLSVPVSAFKGGDFRSGDLTARVKDTFFGDNKQTIQIPYVLDNKLQYLSFEIPVSMDVQISGFELKDDGSNADLQIRATYEQGVPEVVGTTQAEKPWSSLQDPNLKDGQILGIQKYDPVLNSQMNLAQFYPKASLNHSQAMFHRQKGQLVLNPQVKLTGPFSVALFDLENQSPHQVLQVSNLLTESDPLKDSIQVQLNAGKTLKANLPLFGFIQSNYVQNGFEISGRLPGSVTWNPLLSAVVMPETFQMPGTIGIKRDTKSCNHYL